MNFIISHLFLVLKIEKRFQNRYQMSPLFNLFSLVDDHDAMLPIEMIVRPLQVAKQKELRHLDCHRPIVEIDSCNGI